MHCRATNRTKVLSNIEKNFLPITCIGGRGGIIMTGCGTGGGALAMATTGLFTAWGGWLAGGAGMEGGGGGCLGRDGLGGGGGGANPVFGVIAGPIFSFSASGLQEITHIFYLLQYKTIDKNVLTKINFFLIWTNLFLVILEAQKLMVMSLEC